MKKISKKTNPLYNRLRDLLTRTGVMYETFSRTKIIVHSGYLSGLILTPEKNYCKVQSANFGNPSKVSHGFSFCVNYSLETLLYKLYKFNILDLKGYSEILKFIDYGKAKSKLSA